MNEPLEQPVQTKPTDVMIAGGKDRRTRKLALLLSITLEAVLIAVVVGKFDGGWLLIELHNLALIVHLPLLILANVLGDSFVLGIVLLLVYEVVLVLIWRAVLVRLINCISRYARTKIQKWALLLVIPCLIIGAFFWELADAHFDRPTPFRPSADLISLIRENDVFALDIYRNLSRQPNNVFFSSYSISSGMGMVCAGARGKTQNELAAALHFNLTESNLHTAFGEFAARLDAVQHWNHLTLNAANSLWYQQRHPLNVSYKELVALNYHGEMRPADFAHSAGDAAREMTAWVGRKTHGKCRQAISANGLSPDTRLALCDTIYFKGNWARQFKRSKTHPAPFVVSSNETVTVPLMDQLADFKVARVEFAEGAGVDLLEMPYYGRDLSMIILLPSDVNGLSQLEQQFTMQNLQEWMTALNQAAEEKIRVSIPRFIIAQSLDLKEEFKRLGVKELFGSNAGLSGMDSRKELCLSDVLHQTFIEVNEQGTEAAAMTLILARSKSQSKSFVANHPFIFLIRDNATGGILFLGRLVNPLKS